MTPKAGPWKGWTTLNNTFRKTRNESKHVFASNSSKSRMTRPFSSRFRRPVSTRSRIANEPWPATPGKPWPSAAWPGTAEQAINWTAKRALLEPTEAAWLTEACYESLLTWADAEVTSARGQAPEDEETRQRGERALAVLERAGVLGRKYWS